MASGIIFDVKRFAIHDGPGIRTSVFLKGCPLSCWWCHNPESQSTEPELLYREHRCLRCGACVEACPQDGRSLSGDTIHRETGRCSVCGTCAQVCPTGAVELVGRRMTLEQVMAEIEKDRAFFDESGGGVTFSGGEPLAQPEFLGQLLDLCRESYIHTAVDTCGFASPQVLRSIAEKADLFLFDLKFMEPRRHAELTGKSNDLILGNLRLLVEMGKEVSVRVPVIPSVTDTAENLEAIGRFVSSLATPPCVRLLPHHKTAMAKYARFNMSHGLSDASATPSERELGALASRLEQYGLEVSY